MFDMQPILLALDLGSTHLKAGAFTTDGQLLGVSSQINRIYSGDSDGQVYHWQELVHDTFFIIEDALSQAINQIGKDISLAGIAIASMAESGLLVDASTGAARTEIFPWFDQRAHLQAQRLQQAADAPGRFLRRGVRPTFKCSLAKLLWLKEKEPGVLDGARWLGAAEYLAYRLTGEMFTDYSLAGRTYAFRIDKKEWDREFLDNLGLPADVFAAAFPSGRLLGQVQPSFLNAGEVWKKQDKFAHRRSAEDFPLCKRYLPGIPVVIAGHDHVCGSLAAASLAGGISTALVFDSIGTAESLVGVFPERLLTPEDYQAGFSYGLHPAPGYLYWMGGLSTSGGSLEWLRSILGDPPLTYAEIDGLMAGFAGTPGDVLYYPFLAGRGAPHTNPQLRGAFLGLSAAHTRADLLRAVLEGVAFEVESIRQAAQSLTNMPIDQLAVAGGGAKNLRWMQMRANITGCRIRVLPHTETTLLGAAILAGLGSGVYKDLPAACAAIQNEDGVILKPDTAYPRNLQGKICQVAGIAGKAKCKSGLETTLFPHSFLILSDSFRCVVLGFLSGKIAQLNSLRRSFRLILINPTQKEN